MLPGANAVISRRRADRPVRPRRAAGGLDPAVGDPAAPRDRRADLLAQSIGAVLVGFGGLVLLLHPSGDATIIGLLACVGAALMWAIGSFASPRISLPRDPLVSTAWQSPARRPRRRSPCGLIGGEVGDVHFAEFSGRSIFGLLYLITFGSLLAFTSYAWLLQNAPISKVSTYAYVNPVVAIALGWLILDEGDHATDPDRRGDHRRLRRARRSAGQPRSRPAHRADSSAGATRLRTPLSFAAHARRHPAPRGRARGALARVPGDGQGRRGGRVRVGLARRPPAL